LSYVNALKGFEYLCIELADDFKAQIWPHLPRAIDFIDRALTARKKDGKSTVLVMSTNGRSRPVTVVTCYLMYVNKMSYQDALAFIQLKRRNALPNANFVSQLGQFQTII